jgi:hypothetical protein
MIRIVDKENVSICFKKNSDPNKNKTQISDVINQPRIREGYEDYSIDFI